MDREPYKDQGSGSSVGSLILGIVATVVACAALGLSIFAVMKDQSKIDKISVIEQDVGSLKKAEVERNAGVTTISRADIVGDEADNRYIIIEKWGVKFKFPEELKTISYKFSGEELLMSAALAGDGNTYAYNDVNECPVSTMTRSLESQLNRYGEASYVKGTKIGDYYYYPWYPQHNCSYSSSESFDSEGLAATYVYHMLQVPENVNEPRSVKVTTNRD
jgi:hypothetical protein